MKIDIDLLEDRLNAHQREIQRLEEIKRIVCDPESLALLEAMLRPDGQTGSAKEPDHGGSTYKVARRPAFVGSKGIADAVRNALIDRDEPFDAYGLAKELEDGGFKFTSKNPGVSVMDALRRILKNGGIELVHAGSAGIPSLFRVTKKGD